jgi:hypothetical protein
METESETPQATAVYIARDGQPTGPFSIDQLRTMIAQGSVSVSDLAWYEGAADWLPVAHLLPGESTASRPPPPPPPALPGPPMSRLGLVGSIIGLAGIPIWLVIVVVAATSGTNSGSGSAQLILVGFSAIGMLGANVVGAVLGVLAITKQSARKRFTIAGFVLNLLQALGILLLMFIGLTIK